jgi:hypothetical protein
MILIDTPRTSPFFGKSLFTKLKLPLLNPLDSHSGRDYRMAANSAVSSQYYGSFFAINSRDGANCAVRSDLNTIFNNDPMFRIEVGKNSYIYVFPGT